MSHSCRLKSTRENTATVQRKGVSKIRKARDKIQKKLNDENNGNSSPDIYVRTTTKGHGAGNKHRDTPVRQPNDEPIHGRSKKKKQKKNKVV